MKLQCVYLIAFVCLFSALASCVSIEDRMITPYEEGRTVILGQVAANFHSHQVFHVISKRGIAMRAYARLLEEARRQYGPKADVRNIRIEGSGSAFGWINAGGAIAIASVFTVMWYPLAFIVVPIAFPVSFLISGNTQRITATGDVVAAADLNRYNSYSSNITPAAVPRVIVRAVGSLINQLPENSNIAVIGVAAEDRETASFILDELEFQLVAARKFTIVDRKNLDDEQDFQMSREVSDTSVVSIGERLGAGIVITGSVSGSGFTQRLSIKALDVETGRIIAMARELL